MTWTIPSLSLSALVRLAVERSAPPTVERGAEGRGAMTWRASYFDLVSGLFVPQLVTWDPESGEFTSVEGLKGFETWAEEAGRFLWQLEGLESGGA